MYLSLAESHRIGSVSRPRSSRSWSLHRSSSETVCRSKKSASGFLGVISHAVALAPLSQNSKGCGLAGLAHEQLTQAKPSGLFCLASSVPPLTITCSCSRMAPTSLADPQPPAGMSVFSTVTLSFMAATGLEGLCRLRRRDTAFDFIAVFRLGQRFFT